MSETTKKTVRKLVTLTRDLARRVEEYRKSSGAASESDALKALIQDGLRLREKPADLFERCEMTTLFGENLGELFLLVADHPQVYSVVSDTDFVTVNLRIPQDKPDQRFRFSKADSSWEWQEALGGNYNDGWRVIRPGPEPAKKRSSPPGDDDIPF
jgi:hypothetical protein